MASCPQHTPRASNIKIVSICQPSGRGRGEGATEPGRRVVVHRLPYADMKTAITGSCEVHRCDLFRHVAPPLAQAAAGHFLREAAGHDIAAYIDLPRPPGGEAPTAGTLTPALSLPGRGRSAHIASREQPTLVRRARAFWARNFLRDRTGAAAVVSLAPAGGEGLGEGGRE